MHHTEKDYQSYVPSIFTEQFATTKPNWLSIKNTKTISDAKKVFSVNENTVNNLHFDNLHNMMDDKSEKEQITIKIYSYVMSHSVISKFI